MVQVQLSVEQPCPRTAVIHSSFTLRPTAAADADAGAAAAGGAGVGEFGGAHWFAAEEQAECPEEAAASAGGADAASVPASAEGHISIVSRVSVTADGAVCLAWEVDAGAALPAPLAPGLRPSLPRVGLHGRCPKGLQQVVWYGMGPHECYADRQASARLAQHSL